MAMVYKEKQQQDDGGGKTPVKLDGERLTPALVAAVAYEAVPVALEDEAMKRVVKCRAMVEELVATGQVVYGVTTGFGKFSDVRISRKTPCSCSLI